MLGDKIEPEPGLRLDDRPLSALQCLADYLIRAGSLEDISVEPLSVEVWQ